ncbi:MAG: hypothetical protein ACE3L7_07390 [Candidatus Pristimantibacillus sp.]
MPVLAEQPHILPQRSDAAVKKRKQPNDLPIPNIVKTYQLGNTTIHIADNAYRDKTTDQLEQVWKDFYAAAWVILEKAEQSCVDDITL